MKKNSHLLMIAGLIVGGVMCPASSVFASVVDNGDGSQTIHGQQDAQIEFKGQIGEIDPGDPNIDPKNPDLPKPGTDWVKVSLPTKVVYYSTSSSKHKNIDSGDYKVTNQSVYPVEVQLTGFVGQDGVSAPDINHVGNLALKSGTSSIDLVKDHIAQTPNATIFKLGTDTAKSNRQDDTGLSMDSTFKITGTTAIDAKLNKRTALNNKLDITLVGLDRDGNTSV